MPREAVGIKPSELAKRAYNMMVQRERAREVLEMKGFDPSKPAQQKIDVDIPRPSRDLLEQLESETGWVHATDVRLTEVKISQRSYNDMPPNAKMAKEISFYRDDELVARYTFRPYYDKDGKLVGERSELCQNRDNRANIHIIEKTVDAAGKEKANSFRYITLRDGAKIEIVDSLTEGAEEKFNKHQILTPAQVIAVKAGNLFLR